MKLSVCIFTYNHKQFIERTIESVLSQTTEFDFEVVVGEDCSTDGTRCIVKSFQQRYPGKIRGIYNERNLGMMENNSHTILQARGEYVAILDGDDYWTNERKLQEQVNFLEAHPEYVYCFHDARILKQDGQWHERTCCGPDHKKVVRFEDVICDVHIPTASLVFRRKAIDGYPPAWFNSLNAPDRPLFLLLASRGPGYYFNEPWSVYRQHSNGTWTGQHYQSRWLTHLQIFSVMNRHFNGLFEKGFCRCTARVNYILAMELLKDKKLRRARCAFRNYKRASGWRILMPGCLVKMAAFEIAYFRSLPAVQAK